MTRDTPGMTSSSAPSEEREMGGEDLTARRTKIVCTLGPACDSDEGLEALIRAGMNVARINFSHGTHDQHAATIARVRRVAERLGAPIAILQDLQGPKIRTGGLSDGHSVGLRAGQAFTITARPIEGSAEAVSTTYERLPRDVKPGDRILLSDGAIELRVERVAGPDIHTRVVNGGELAEHQGINLPGVAVSAPALTAKDREDLTFGVAQHVDYIALSFVRRAQDVREAQRLVRQLIAAQPDAPPAHYQGAQDALYAADRAIPIIAKIEKPEAVQRLDAILEAADGVMVARGDLGVEMPLESVPLVQKRIITKANALGLPVITATQMLESMITHPRPTRAEASDVANAILDGTDAVMLSAETAIGQYPVAAVEVMARIATATDVSMLAHGERTGLQGTRSLEEAIAAAARTLAEQARAAAIVVLTRTGASARLMSKERPRAPILAFTPVETVYRRLALWWGVTPHRGPLDGTIEDRITWVDEWLRAEVAVRAGDEVVVMGGMPTAGRPRPNFLKLQRIGEN
jgi:pyruvate kinase